jgi:hypothetical protein
MDGPDKEDIDDLNDVAKSRKNLPTQTSEEAHRARQKQRKQARDENAALSKLDSLKIRSQNVQQSLLENMKASVLASSVVYETGEFNNDQNLFPYLGPPELLLSLITNPAEAKEFVNATPAQLSMLEPLLKFSIVDQDGNSEPVAFSSYSSEENLLSLASLRATQGSTLLKSRRTEGTNVGVKKFSWKYHNLHEGDYVLSANLQLYFGSLAELVNERYMQFLWLDGNPTPLARSLKPKDAGQTNSQKLKNLSDQAYNISHAAPWSVHSQFWADTKGETHVFPLASYGEYFSACESLTHRYQAGAFRKLEVQCGWSVPSGKKSELMSLFAGGDRGRRDKMNKFLEGVAATQKTIFLNLSDYDIDFAQDGTTTLSINYFGSADVRINSGEKSDVLGTAMSHRTTKDRYWSQEFPMENPAQYGFNMEKLTRRLSYLGTQMADPQAGGAPLDRPSGAGVLPDQVWLSLRGIEADHKYFMLQLEQAKLEAAMAIAAPEPKKKIQELEDLLEQIGTASRVMRRIVGPLRYNKFLRALMDSKRIFTARAETKVILQDPTTGLGEVQTNLEFRPWHSADVSTAKALDAQKARLKAYAKSYKAQKTADGTSFKIDKDTIKKLLKNSFDKTQDYTKTGVNGYTGRYDVFYTRLGDILAVGIELAGLALTSTPAFILGSFSPSQAKLKGFTPATASQRNRATAHSAALNWGSQAFGGQDLSDNEEYMMLYDIPISIDYFNEWFMEQVIEKERTQWPFRQFLDALLDLATKLINFITETKGQLSLDYTVQTLTGKYLLARRDARHGFVATGKPTIEFWHANPEEAVGGGVLSPIDLRSTKDAVAAVTSYTKGGLGLPVHINNGNDIGELFQPLDTYIISARQMGMGYRTGDRDYDESEGIFHYVLGAERGIAKSFNFVKTDQPYYREMQLEAMNNTGRSRALIIPQNIELEMVGNNLHKNGDYIYIDSRSLLGTYANSTLSLGGYYGVYESENEITAQGFTTRVKGIYQASAE